METDIFREDVPGLLKRHFDTLAGGSGIALDVIKERGYRSALGEKQLKDLGFRSGQRRLPGLLIPVRPPDGSGNLYCYRPDNPRQSPDGKALKYELPAGSSVRLDVPPRCRPNLADPSVPLWLTEGQKKADALASHGLCAVALLGVWNFKGRNELGGVSLLADFDLIAWNGREVNVVFDSDVMTKPQVQGALERLTEHLKRKGARVSAVYLPGGPDGQKVGADDYLLSHTAGELKALAKAPVPSRGPAARVLKLLDEPPAFITRPLRLVNGRASAVAWLWAKEEVRETVNSRTGKVILHDPPIVRNKLCRLVVTEDGVAYGEHGDKPLEELGAQVDIPFQPETDKLWSTAGYRRYRDGVRPEATDVFERLVALFDRFISFDRSLADQRVMCEMVACYTLSTWFLDAFDVIGFLQPNGGYGCGKTKLGMLICEVAYLGEALLSGSSYSCLRDLANMGATLLFDDAETLADPKKIDPDKRNLLLAGNRRGTRVAFKEPAPDGTWQIRYVNAYCPRLFTAIRLPDPVLASRTIVVPLVRTADEKKANAEIKEESEWPCDRRKLLDDLWALSLANLAGMPAHQAAVNKDAPLVGRNLEPWKAILSIAHWLEETGVEGLYGRMCKLARDYQSERKDLETPDLTKLVVKALVALAPSAPLAPLAPLNSEGRSFAIAICDVTSKVNELAKDDDLVGSVGGDYSSDRKVGRILSALRLKEAPKRSGQRRSRVISFTQLDDIARSYGLSPLSERKDGDEEDDENNSPPALLNGANGANGAEHLEWVLEEAVRERIKLRKEEGKVRIYGQPSAAELVKQMKPYRDDLISLIGNAVSIDYFACQRCGLVARVADRRRKYGHVLCPRCASLV